MLCSFLLHSKANQSHTHTHTHTHTHIYIFTLFVCLFVCFAFHLGHHRALSGLPVLCSSFSLSDMDYHLTNDLSFFLYLCGVCICVWPYICEDYVQYQIQIWISNALVDILAAMIIGGEMAKKYLNGLYFKPGEKIIFTQLFHWILENLLSFTNLKDRQVKSIQFKNTSLINSYLLKCIALFNFPMTAF